MPGQTLSEKIVTRFSVDLLPDQKVYSGDYVSIRPRHVMTHDNTGAVIPKFKSIGATRIADPQQPVFALDHDVQNESPANLAKYAEIAAFARANDIAFFPARRGIAHQIMVEEGFVLPGSLVVGSDSHSNIYGALAAVGTSVVRTDAAAIWATGKTWWQVPEIIKVNLTGTLRPGVTGKDVILSLIGLYSHDEVLNAALEFVGPGIISLSMDQRLTIANMTTEWGALVGLFPYDQVTHAYLAGRVSLFKQRGDAQPRVTDHTLAEIAALDLKADPDAYYAAELSLDLSTVQPSIAGPNEVKIWQSLGTIAAQQVKIDKAYLMSCVNGRLEDFAVAAKVLENRQVAKDVKFYVAAASAAVEASAREKGYWQTLLSAGAIPLPPGCGPCIGLGTGVLEAGEVGISATNRNFKGRMGSPQAFVYLASPAVVAASAATGYISGNADFTSPLSLPTIVRSDPLERETMNISLLAGFPTTITGHLIFLPKDNLNTDGIYGKEFTYQDKISPAEMATKALLNYDPSFQEIAREGDLLVGGLNFGSGSSREQAATALKYRGIAMVIAGSFSQIFKRNAFNNGYIALECPSLLEDLRATIIDPPLTYRSPQPATVDFTMARIYYGERSYNFAPLGPIAQQLILAGGFENLLRQQLENGK